MFWLVMFITVSALTFGVSRLSSPVILWALLTLVLWPIFTLFFWLNKHSGQDALMVFAFKQLSGVNAPADVFDPCDPEERDMNIFLQVPYAFLLFFIALFNFFPFAIALVGIPVGILISLFGVVYYLHGKDKNIEPMMYGLNFTTLGFGSIVVAGLVMRLLRYLSDFGCPPV